MKLGRPGRQGVRARSAGAWPSARGTPRRGDAARPGTRGLRRWPRLLRRWRLTPSRAAAILGLLASIGSLYGLATTPAFTLARTELPALRWTATDALIGAVATADGTNLFRIQTGPIEDRLRRLPGVAKARATVSLPDTLIVEIQEREAIMAWAVGDTRFLVDREGVIFAALGADTVTSDVPTIADSRPGSAAFAVGSVVDPVDLDAATRLGSLTPASIESRATGLVITVTEANGFVVGTIPRSWIAVFGLYTPTLRTPDLIPGQVRLLRSLLAGREDLVEKVILADADSGTFVPKATTAP
ncbi:MAG: FtsQ-type POTRA domain-containing protein [Chloroflexota bacterium]